MFVGLLIHQNLLISRIRSRLASIARYGSLPPAVLCVLYSAFVMPLYDYCDVVWLPTTAKLNCLIERVHSKFLNKLPPAYRSRFSSTLTERRRFHTAVQIFKSIHQISPPYLHKIFQFSRDVTGHISRNFNRLFVPRVSTNFGKRSFFIKELYCETVYHQMCLRLQPCHRLKIYILILIDFLFCTGFCCSLFFVTVFCCNFIFVVVFLC